MPSFRRARRVGFRVLVGVLALVAIAVLFTVAINLLMIHDARPFVVKEAGQAPSAPVAIVLGAGFLPDGTSSPMLADRLDEALALLRAGKVKTLLLTGDGRPQDDQVTVMRTYLVDRGVPVSDLLLDRAGLDTRESMLRASEVFHVKTALVPTQGFHLARAVYLARASGIKATGVPAKFRSYRGTLATMREWAARVKAFLQVHL